MFGLPPGSGGPCNCTPGYLCVPPNGYHRAECPVIVLASQLMMAPPVFVPVPVPDLDANGLPVRSIRSYTKDELDLIRTRAANNQIPNSFSDRQSWNETMRPMTSISLEKKEFEAPGVSKLRAENESLRRENARLKDENEILRKDVLKARQDLRLVPSLKDKMESLRRELSVDQKVLIPGVSTRNGQTEVWTTEAMAAAIRDAQDKAAAVRAQFTSRPPASTPSEIDAYQAFLFARSSAIDATTADKGPTNSSAPVGEWKPNAYEAGELVEQARKKAAVKQVAPETFARVVDMEDDGD